MAWRNPSAGCDSNRRWPPGLLFGWRRLCRRLPISLASRTSRGTFIQTRNNRARPNRIASPIARLRAINSKRSREQPPPQGPVPDRRRHRQTAGHALRPKRLHRGGADFYRDAGAPDADGHLYRHRESQVASIEHLQRRADALYAADHLVRHRDARRIEARLSGVAWLHPPSGGFRHLAVSNDQGGRAGHRDA